MIYVFYQSGLSEIILLKCGYKGISLLWLGEAKNREVRVRGSYCKK